MKIERYKKINNCLYELYLSDGRRISLYDDIILKYELLLKNEFNDDLIDSAIFDNKYYEFYYSALKYIKYRSRSVGEVYNKLIDGDCPKNTVFDIINKLISQGYLDDNVYANSYINEQILITSKGPLKIKNELIKKGVDEGIIDQSMELYTSDIEREKINKIIIKKIKSNRNKSKIELKRKIVNDLLVQGFSKGIVMDVLNNFTISDDLDIKKREYDKLYKRLSRKYSGQILENKIKEKMYQKGFY